MTPKEIKLKHRITVKRNVGAPDGYQWGAWLGEFELHCTVGTGRTPDEAVEDLLEQLKEAENEGCY